MIEIAICDDDIPLTSEIESMVMALGAKHNISVNCSVFFDGTTLLKSIKDGNRYQIIYLDIKMPHLDGRSTAVAIRESNFFVLLIYMSSHERCLPELFETEPFRFLSKPFDTDCFESLFLKAYEKLYTPTKFFTFNSGKSIHHIPLNDIMFFESNNRLINIHTVNAIISYYEKMSHLEHYLVSIQCLFIRIHQSYLVNYNFIRKITRTSLELADGKILPISEAREKEVLHKFSEFVHMGVR